MDDTELDYWFVRGRKDYYRGEFSPPDTLSLRLAYQRGWHAAEAE